MPMHVPLGFIPHDANRFPTGKLVIDPNSEQARGLIYCGLAGDGRQWIDLAQDDVGVWDQGLSITHDRFGPSLEATGNTANDRLSFGGTRQFIDTAAPFTIAWQSMFRSGSTALVPCVAMLRSDTAGPFFLVYSLNASYSDVFFGNQADTWLKTQCAFPASVAVENDWHWIVFRYNGNGATTQSNFRLQVNNQATTLSAGGATGADTTANQFMEMNTTTAPFLGALKQFRIYDYEWPDPLADSFYAPGKRWDLFKSDREITDYLPVAAAGGPTTFPAAMMGGL